MHILGLILPSKTFGNKKALIFLTLISKGLFCTLVIDQSSDQPSTQVAISAAQPAAVGAPITSDVGGVSVLSQEAIDKAINAFSQTETKNQIQATANGQVASSLATDSIASTTSSRPMSSLEAMLALSQAAENTNPVGGQSESQLSSSVNTLSADLSSATLPQGSLILDAASNTGIENGSQVVQASTSGQQPEQPNYMGLIGLSGGLIPLGASLFAARRSSQIHQTPAVISYDQPTSTVFKRPSYKSQQEEDSDSYYRRPSYQDSEPTQKRTRSLVSYDSGDSNGSGRLTSARSTRPSTTKRR